jgi:hypothetical protein
MENKRPTYGNGKICYLEIPANNIEVSASFYENRLAGKSGETMIMCPSMTE